MSISELFVGALPERLRASSMPAQIREPGDLEVQLSLPAWSVMRSTDRDYVYRLFPRLNQQFRVHITGHYDLRGLAIANAQYTIERLAHALGSSFSFHGYLPGVHVRRSTDVVFAYGQFPVALNRDVPILWEHTFAPQLGDDPGAWQQQLRAGLLRAVQAAARVVTATEVSASWFCRAFPEASHKIATIPYLLPDLSAISVETLERKAAEPGPVRVIFVGKQGRRKGLDTLVEAWALLDPATRRKLSVTAVSAMLDGGFDLPPEWTHLSFAPDVLSLMRDAHVLAFPTKQEAYGLVLVEGMAAGCAILTTSAIIQRSIVGDDPALFVDPTDASAVAAALTQLVADRALLTDKMRAARARFIEAYEPSRVGERYAKLLWDCAGRTAPSVARHALTAAP